MHQWLIGIKHYESQMIDQVVKFNRLDLSKANDDVLKNKLRVDRVELPHQPFLLTA
ncbi:hypothetical protein LZZ85_06675 [Terrimonas sp. NA20]|uniref:Uncharacterized protein n=1 Tax=Terrimonas ginsenosidimutans TaxID=2908004 RepID=A0ABS9KNP7_9BACT|nr:hypothetical protein [Terrimonas ginsenosidimutans]MCG2613956.1 hypothetical protein [Terrimonas ginsenosidimutans]